MRNLFKKMFSSDIEAKINSFPQKFRAQLMETASTSDRFCDLLSSFPAAAFAVSTGYGSEQQRENALRLIEAGQPLRIIAEALNMPYWMRKLPPDVFATKLCPFPNNTDFNRKIAGCVPKEKKELTNWLYFVPRAAKFGTEEFALWLAKQDLFNTSSTLAGKMYIMAAYAWFSKRKDLRAGQLIDMPWHKSASFDNSIVYTLNWIRNIKIEAAFGPDGLNDSWLNCGKIMGYEFVPLMTAVSLQEEGQEMDHCVADYSWSVATGECRIFSLRKDGKRVATLEIKRHYEHADIPLIEQLQGYDNEAVPHGAWQATFAWLATQNIYDLPVYDHAKSSEPKPETWTRLWKPYWDEKGATPFLPRQVTGSTLPNIEQQFATD